jgi:hypothetical protein
VPTHGYPLAIHTSRASQLRDEPVTAGVPPIVFGLDKFANVLTDWPDYLAPWVNDLVPGTGQQAMYAVGMVEILAGIVVALAPRYGGLLVAAWLAGIIGNLLLIPGYYDVALRDFGLLVAALALSRLAAADFAPTGQGPTRQGMVQR